jgi:hypothetical protein
LECGGSSPPSFSRDALSSRTVEGGGIPSIDDDYRILVAKHAFAEDSSDQKPRIEYHGERLRLGTDSETLNRQFRLHLHRGISHLAIPNHMRGIGDLVGLREG